jgi:hypothetical protein
MSCFPTRDSDPEKDPGQTKDPDGGDVFRDILENKVRTLAG